MEAKLTNMLALRLKSEGLVVKTMATIRSNLDSTDFTDIPQMQALLKELVSRKDKFNEEHNKVTDLLPPTSTDAAELHQHADAMEQQVGELYAEGTEWIVTQATDHEVPGIPNGGTEPPEPQPGDDQDNETPPAEPAGPAEPGTPATVPINTDDSKDNPAGVKKKDSRKADKGSGKDKPRDDKFRSEFQKTTSRALYDIKDMLSYNAAENAMLQKECRDKEQSISFLQQQRQEERASFLHHINELESRLEGRDAARTTSTPGPSESDKAVRFEQNVSNVKYTCVNDIDTVSNVGKLQSVIGNVKTGSDGSKVARDSDVRYEFARGNVTQDSVYVSPNSSYTRSGLGDESVRFDNLSQSLALNRLVSQNNQLLKSFIDDSRDSKQEVTGARDTPKTKLSTFTGDPLDYWLFTKCFNELVGNSSLKSAKKLNVLVNHVNDATRKLISSCLLMDPDVGYKKAVAVLKSKFGSPFLISQAWKNKLCGYPRVVSADLLSAFSEDLSCCYNTLSEMSYTAQLENVDTISQITSRLPNYLRAKWRRKHRRALEDGRVGSLEELKDLVVEAAAESADPFYNDDRLDKILALKTVDPRFAGQQATDGSKFPRRASYKIQAEESHLSNDDGEEDGFERQISIMASEFKKKVCHCCESSDHFTSKCPVYLKLSPVERLGIARKNKLCLLCLGADHFIGRCKQTWRCQEKGCIYKHHNSLHGAFGLPTKTNSDVQTFLSDDRQHVGIVKGAEINVIEGSNQVEIYRTVTLKFAALPTTPVIVQGPGGRMATYALLDTASNTTICTDRLMEQLQCPRKGSADLTVNTVMGKCQRSGAVYDFEVKGCESEIFFPVFDAVALKDLPVSSDHILTAEELRDWPHLATVDIPEVEMQHVGLLIGQDNAHLLRPGRRVDGLNLRDPYAVETPLGWTVYGFKSGRKITGSSNANINSTILSNDHPLSLERIATRFWELESVPKVERISSVNLGVLNYWDANVKLVDGQIVVPIPFKKRPPDFPDNRQAVLQRFESLGRRLKKNPELLRMYTTAMDDNFKKGYAKVVTHQPKPGRSWNLTQLVVEHRRKPGVARPVFNASYVFRNRCLNLEAHQGPDQNNRLVDVLLNFRLYRFAMTCDIQSMFNRIKVPEEDSDYLRFLYWKDGNPDNEVIDCCMTTHAFGCIWSPAVATYCMHKSIELTGTDPESPVAIAIRRGFYVDDCLRCNPEVHRLIRLLLDLRDTLSKVSFNLTKVASNSREVLEAVPEKDRAMSTVDLNLCGGLPVAQYSLGQRWMSREDTFTFVVEFLEEPETRRQLLSTMSTLFDPMGLCSPFLVPARRMFQELSRRGLAWDDQLPADVKRQWKKWVADAKDLEGYEVPRWVGFHQDNVRACLVHFSDASEIAYGAVTYFCTIDVNGLIINSVILMARCKLAPLKSQSIPRLELCGAVLAAESDETLRSYLDVDLLPSTFWTDSTLVLRYVTSQPTQFKTFVANRVSQLLQLTDRDQWSFVPGTDNPADVLSRGASAKELIDDKRWSFGPQFLREGREKWPAQPDFLLAELPAEEIKKERDIYAASISSNVTIDLQQSHEFVRDILLRYSSWTDMVRHMSWITKAAQRFKACNPTLTGEVEPQLTVEDLQVGELLIIKTLQALYLTKEETDSKSFKKLFPRLRNGLRCVGGRLERSRFSEDFVHPYIFPGGNHITEVYIRHCHERVYHSGVERTLLESRKKVWILGGRRTIDRVVKNCKFCLRFKGAAMSQFMSPLPPFRLSSNVRPFTNVGLDYFGPFHIKVGRSTVKRFACVIVCSATRAVHIEPAVDMSTSGFLNAFMRFVARRGRPLNVLSDNGTNFVGAKVVIDKETAFWNHENVPRYCADRGINWRYNPPAASHFGGFWERQIRDIRSLALWLLKGVSLSEDMFHTTLCLVEQMMNSRPLTKLTDDPEDMEPLTPNHILMLESTENLKGVHFDKDVLRRSWKQGQRLADIFWKRWLYQYVTQLQKRTKWLKEMKNLKEGDLVLIVDQNEPRMKWPLGLVMKAYAGSDGLVRSAEVKTQTGIYTRPIAKLVHLEGELVEE